ncbi:MAG: helix-turn-helix transcriptional regulator [Ruminococcaceae bacterium]|nr:helix-turn-helix transcriptional regulator [Oscillospiraceae bacterium]
MNLGQKIKNLRVEKMMTQKELAGGEITRNMLSQIENGLAQPSLSTVFYLAKKLSVPAGYLLSEGDEEFIYNKTAAMKNIKRAYVDRNFELCRDICLSSFNEFDDELELILTDCCFGVAENSMKEGQLHKARDFLDEAILHSESTMFNTVTQRNGIAVMFEMLKEISPALDSNETDTVISEDLFHPSIFDSILCKYITVILNEEKYDAFIDDISKIQRNDLSKEDQLFVLHLKARSHIRTNDHQAALKLLYQVIDSEEVPPRLLLYLACSDMEICFREMNDYKGAYEFSQNKIEILEHMLAEI